MDEEYLTQEKPEVQKGLSFSKRDIVQIIFKRKYLILIVLFVTLILAIIAHSIYPVIKPPLYEASSTLLVKFGPEFRKEALYRPELSEVEGGGSPFIRANIIGSEIQILLSKKVKEETLRNIGVENIYPELVESPQLQVSTTEIGLSILDKNLIVNELRGSDVIRVSFTHTIPDVASKVVNSLIDIYQVKRLEILTDPRSISFLKQMVEQYAQKLKESEEKFSNYKKKYNLYSLEDQKSSLLEQQVSLNTTLKETQNRIDELKQTLSFLEKQIIENPKLLSTVAVENYQAENKVVAQLEARLIDLKLKENELLQNFKETSTVVVKLREEMRLMREFIEKEQKKIQSDDSSQSQAMSALEQNPAYMNIELDIIKDKYELEALNVKEKNLLQQLKQVDQNLQDLYLHTRQYNELAQEVAESEKNYQILYKRYETASISEQMEQQKMTSISIIERATPPFKPIKGQKGIMIFLAGGLLLGLSAGSGLAVVIEFLKKVISLPEKAGKLMDLPVLVSVPYVKNLQK